MRSTLSPRRRTRLLHLGLVLLATLVFFTARAVWQAWQDRSGQARADAIVELIDERTPLRPTDTPGASAWLQLELDRYGRRAGAEADARFGAFAGSGTLAPTTLEPVVAALRRATGTQSDPSAIRVVRQVSAADARRAQALLEYRKEHFALTYRKTTVASPDDDGFVREAIGIVAAAEAGVMEVLSSQPLPVVPDSTAPHPVRVYAIAEDGALLSAPWQSGAESDARELELLGSRPWLPAFAPQEFFFRFPVDAPPSATWYSGLYLDLGGRGLVSTVMLPFTAAGRSAVLALDLAFDVDWQSFARSVSAPVTSAAVSGVASEQAPWSMFLSVLPADTEGSLRAAIQDLARDDAGSVRFAAPVRQGIAGEGTVVAFHVAESTWLLMLFPRSAPTFPFVPLLLTAGLLTLLLAGLEVNRRRAEREQRKAEQAFAEKQNLLDTMQVPLVVVDPNTDVIVSSNRSADAIGLRAGSRFADFVSPDPAARAHYQAMQVATPEPRRAYGVPVRVPGLPDVPEQHAIVRSVAVTAPIAALHADERHRLGIVFLVDRETDLALFESHVSAEAHREERQRLAGLLSHGVDTLARVLEHQLRRTDTSDDGRAFVAWLAEYLERRLTVTGWLLDHWDSQPSGIAEVVIDSTQARATFDRLTTVFALAAKDRDMRARLHWSNGVLSAEVHPPVDLQCEWPEAVVISCPIRGGFGVLVGELLTNAIRHGVPGHAPRCSVSYDRVRRVMAFTIINDMRSGSSAPLVEAYGGLDIVRVLARLCGWTLDFTPSATQFIVTWTAPASDRGIGGQPD